jgi:hypothetical protein
MSEPQDHETGHETGTRQPLRIVPGTGSERPASGPSSPRWGSLAPRRGVALVAASAVLGTLVTVLTGSDPGFALGLLVVIGTIAACLAVRARGVYWIIPAPALAYLAGAVISGLVHDRAADTSSTELTVNAARWIASGFLAMAIATALAVGIAVARRLLSNRRLLPPDEQFDGGAHGSRLASSPMRVRSAAISSAPWSAFGDRQDVGPAITNSQTSGPVRPPGVNS